ncbi:MAG: sugar ABC transporter substrate-binding protein [Chloroflexota bacterium]
MVFGDPAEFAAYQELVTAFEAQHPNIDVQLDHIPSQAEYRQKLATRFAANEPPDVMLLNYRRFGAFAEAGALVPLDEQLAASEVIGADDFFPIAIESFELNGRLWCIPQNVSSLVVYYNKDLFDAANVAYPQDDWTREQFLAAARQLTQDTNGDGTIDQYGVGLKPNIFRLAPFLWQDGLEIVDNPAAPTKLTIQSETLQWFVDLQVVEGVVPSAEAEAAQDSESRFLNGTLAMMFNSRRGVPTYRTIESFEWDVAPLPRGKQAAGILHSDAYCMAATAENKTAVWTFIEFANSVEGQTLVAASGRTVPSLMAVAESDTFLAPGLRPKNGRIYIDTIPILRTVPIMGGWVAVEERASREIERAFYGHVSVEEAAQFAEEETAQYFR